MKNAIAASAITPSATHNQNHGFEISINGFAISWYVICAAAFVADCAGTTNAALVFILGANVSRGFRKISQARSNTAGRCGPGSRRCYWSETCATTQPDAARAVPQ